MSADLELYSPRPTLLTREELRVVLESIGFFVLFTDEKRNVLPDGALREEWLMAVRRAKHLPQLREALAARDEAQLDAMSKSKTLACCALLAEDSLDPSHALPGLTSHPDARVAAAASAARTHYRFNLSFQASEVSGRLFEGGWKALGQSIGGLLDDPQSGELTLVENGVSKRLVKGRGCLSFLALIIRWVLILLRLRFLPERKI